MMRHRSSHFPFAYCSFSFGFACRELHCLKVLELVLVSLVVNYIVDLMMCVIICYVNYIPVYSAYFKDTPSRDTAKTGSSKKINLLYLSIS
jgi:hypothetical protein